MSYPTVFPTLNYDDAPAALDFIVEAFGAERHAVYFGDDGGIQHAEVRFGNGIVMIGPASEEYAATRGRSGGVCVVIADPDAHHDRAKAAGAEITRALQDTHYGSRDYTAKDPEGNSWYFSTYQPFTYDPEAATAKATA